ncbi:toxin-antitoxin system, antitoxin component [Salmonella enterica]|nr:toxin-antitoxin system, antitoxin component [Salmonella enterica subsp. enterica serovar Oranienburg]EDT7533272.1 toxin-antitoxin system, antitoxin component [Salmonella enterica subsp. enterica serovar Adelaide]EGX3500240.1 toxin-antitoxin system, antitoxin component [Salmonella enterica]
MVRFKRNELPVLTAAREEELRVMAGRPDSDIDYSDIPPLSDALMAEAVRGRFWRPVKAQTSVRIYADILEWLKAPGEGYQIRLNAILREAMLRKLQRK